MVYQWSTNTPIHEEIHKCGQQMNNKAAGIDRWISCGILQVRKRGSAKASSRIHIDHFGHAMSRKAFNRILIV